jgi:hypothetical protein
MGTFLSTTYIYIGDANPDALTDQLRTRIMQYMLGLGYREVASRADATRSVSICRSSTCPWLAVLDQNDNLLAHDDIAAQTITNESDQYAVEMQLHDSDVLRIGLYRHGKALDRVVSPPDYFGKIGKSERASVKGNPDVWQAVLKPGATSAQLKKAWSGKHVFADENWAAVAALLDIDERLAFMRGDEVSDDSPSADIKLYFANDQADAPIEDAQEIALKFSIGGGDSWTALDAPLNWRFTVSANHEIAEDIVVAIWGDAVVDGLIKDVGASIEIREIERGLAPNIVQQSMVDLNPSEIRLEGSIEPFTAYVGRAAQCTIPEVEFLSAFEKGPMRTCVLTILGQPTRVGAGVVNVYVAPSSDLQKGATHKAFTLTVRDLRQERADLGWVPLRAREPVEVYQREQWMQSIRRLTEASEVVAMVVFDGGENRFGAMLPEFLTGWVSKLQLSPSQRLRGTLWGENGRSQIINVRKSAAPSGKSWAKFTSLAALAQQFAIDAGSIPFATARAYLHWHAQFRKEIGWLTPAAHTLFLTYDVKDLAPELRQQRTSELREVIERCVAQTNVLQATLAEWPYVHYLHQTPYEGAIDNQSAHDAVWCQTYLRALAPEMWLGPELRARLEAGTEFGDIAEVKTRSRGGVYLRLYGGKTLADLEQRLAPLLATIEDDRDWIQRGNSE